MCEDEGRWLTLEVEISIIWGSDNFLDLLLLSGARGHKFLGCLGRDIMNFARVLDYSAVDGRSMKDRAIGGKMASQRLKVEVDDTFSDLSANLLDFRWGLALCSLIVNINSWNYLPLIGRF